MPVRATRLSDRPIITPHMDVRMGSNINGPAIIRVPDWAAGRLGTYHLYFADHKGIGAAVELSVLLRPAECMNAQRRDATDVVRLPGERFFNPRHYLAS